MAHDEQVLVVERRILEDLGVFQGVTLDVDRYLDGLFAADVPRFMPRPAAEEDPSFKQLIPYVILTHAGRCLSYVRGKRAGETRLVGRKSVGIGGHINPIDEMPLFSSGFREVYLAAVEREVAEEVAVDASHTDSVVALINDDSTEVGQVHLGIVHLWTLDAPEVNKREQMITQMEFASPAELLADREALETWSALCLDSLDAMLEKANSSAGRTR